MIQIVYTKYKQNIKPYFLSMYIELRKKEILKTCRKLQDSKIFPAFLNGLENFLELLQKSSREACVLFIRLNS